MRRFTPRPYQQVGRCLRPHGSKEYATVVDLVGLRDQFGAVEDLVLRPGGKTGTQWAYWSGDRQVTNVLMESERAA